MEMALPLATTSKVDYTTPPAPIYILRGHTSQVSVVAFSQDGRSLYSGDVEGWVIVWDLSTFRPRYIWKAHDAGLLTLVEFQGGLLTHGRDNKIHHFTLPLALRSISRSAASAVPSVKNPTPLESDWSMDSNAMAYCKMSLLRRPIDDLSTLTAGGGKGRERALIAVPALTKDEQIDVFDLSSLVRVHRSIGEGCFIGSKTGTVMSVQLFTHPTCTTDLHLLAAYEDGRVALFSYTSSRHSPFEPPSTLRSENEGWELTWSCKGHREAVMSLAVSPSKEEAWSVGADHHLCRYRLFEEDETKRMDQYETTAPGRSEVAVRADGRIVGIAGWDGEIRVHSSRTGKPLAVLSYHRTSLHALAFGPLPSAQPSATASDEESDSDDESMSGGVRRAWLAVGGKDERISLWDIYPPDQIR